MFKHITVLKGLTMYNEPNIIASFDSNEYAASRSYSNMPKPFITYGLGDDGEVYMQCMVSGYAFTNGWSRPQFAVPFDEMQKIVINFGPLVDKIKNLSSFK